MFYLAGIGLAFFLVLLLLGKNKKTDADWILACWLAVITVHLLLFYFRKLWMYPQLLAAEFPFPLAHGPLLYLYTRAITNRTVPLKYAVLHFLPFIAVCLYLVPFFAMPLEERISVFRNNGAGYEIFNAVRLWADIASGIIYVALSNLVLHRHRKTILNQFSYTEKISLQWLQCLIYWLGLIWIVILFRNDDLIFTTVVLFILFMGYFGIRQGGIFHTAIPDVAVPETVDERALVTEPSERPKYQKSGLSAENSESLHRDLSRLMATEKLFRNSELSLTDLAKHLNTQPNYLSRVINEREGKNFYDYVNALRIDEFKRMAALPENRKYTLIGLAQECGFNSKSSFNRYFKKVTGKAPSEFMQETASPLD